MRRYSYRYAEGREVIFGGHFQYQIRGDYALVLLADHLVPLAVSEIPTRLYRRFLFPLQPTRISFVEFDPLSRCYYLLDLRWTETAGAFRYLGAAGNRRDRRIVAAPGADGSHVQAVKRVMLRNRDSVVHPDRKADARNIIFMVATHHCADAGCTLPAECFRR